MANKCEQEGCFLSSGHDGLHQAVARIYDIEEPKEVPDPEPVFKLEEQVQVVAAARLDAKGASDYARTLRKEWEERNADVLSNVVTKNNLESEAEAKLRELTLQAYRETGNKAPAEGVGIREVIKLEYDAGVALRWGIQHYGIALKLDTKAFETVVKATPNIVDFVKITTEPQATIAQDLDEAKKS